VFGVAWALLVPPWQSPDAVTHYDYTESLAARQQLPGPGTNESSSDVRASLAAIDGAVVSFAAPEAIPSWRSAPYARYRREAGHLSRADGGSRTSADVNPPLYYLYAAIAYLATPSGNEYDRVYSIQLWGVLLLLISTSGAWLLAGELFGRKPLAQLVTATVTGLQPMATFISTSVNPDALLVALWTMFLWLASRVVKRGAQRGDVEALCLVTAAALLTKATSYALLPPLIAALALGWRRRDRSRTGTAREHFVRGLCLLTWPVAAWLVVSAARGRSPVNTIAVVKGARVTGQSALGFLNYLWQFYLPRLPGQALFREASVLPAWPHYPTGLPAWNLWIRQGWAAFGYFDIFLSKWVYGVLAAVTGGVGLATLALVSRFRDPCRRSLLAVLGLTALSLLALLHVVDYRAIAVGDGPVIQGRYALPLISLFGLGCGLLVQRLPPRWRGLAAAGILAGLFSLQILSLATVARTYYT
jgi:4-amino-4-deoxy-L-arabinose transferase-like glycosyltransferase